MTISRAYFAPEAEYEDYAYEPPSKRCCEEHMQKMDQAAGYLEEVLNHLYSKDALDANAFENKLDELCWILGIELRKEDLQIQRLQTQKNTISQFPILENWVTYNNHYLKSVNQ